MNEFTNNENNTGISSHFLRIIYLWWTLPLAVVLYRLILDAASGSIHSFCGKFQWFYFILQIILFNIVLSVIYVYSFRHRIKLCFNDFNGEKDSGDIPRWLPGSLLYMIFPLVTFLPFLFIYRFFRKFYSPEWIFIGQFIISFIIHELFFRDKNQVTS